MQYYVKYFLNSNYRKKLNSFKGEKLVRNSLKLLIAKKNVAIRNEKSFQTFKVTFNLVIILGFATSY
jgi:hypothetical protein